MADDTIKGMAGAYMAAKQARQAGASWFDSALQGVLSGPAVEAAAADPLFSLVKRAQEQKLNMNTLTLDLTRQEMDMGVQKLQDLKDKRDLEMKQREGISQLFKVVGDAAGTDKLGSNETLHNFYDILARYPAIASTPEFAQLSESVTKANQQKKALDLYNAQLKRYGITGGETDAVSPHVPPGQSAHIKNPMTGETITIRGLPEKKPTDKEETISDWMKAKEDLQKASDEFSSLSENDPRREEAQKKVKKAEDIFNAWDGMVRGQTTEITTKGPQGEETSVVIGGRRSPVVPASGGTGNIASGIVRGGLGTKVGVKIAAYESAMELVTQLENSLSRKDVGILGNIQELKNRIVGQLSDSAVDSKVQETRNKIIMLRQSLAREIPEGGRETKEQREDVLKALPSTGILESLGTAKAALSAARNLIQMRAQNYGAEMGRTPLVALTPQQIGADLKADYAAIDERAKAGLMSPEQAKAAKLRAYDEHADALNRFHPEMRTAP